MTKNCHLHKHKKSNKKSSPFFPCQYQIWSENVYLQDSKIVDDLPSELLAIESLSQFKSSVNVFVKKVALF